MDNNKSIDKQFSKEHLSAVLEALIRVKGGEITDAFFGICYNADNLIDNNDEHDAYEVVVHYSPKWPKSTGNPDEPIPYKGLNKWTGEYGQLRYELLDFLIEELTKAVEEYDND